jgi:hypothetical protein
MPHALRSGNRGGVDLILFLAGMAQRHDSVEIRYVVKQAEGDLRDVGRVEFMSLFKRLFLDGGRPF